MAKSLLNEDFYKTFKNYINENREAVEEKQQLKENAFLAGAPGYTYGATKHGYDYADKSKLDNQSGNEVLLGVYNEIQKDPKITTEEALMRVSRNLATDPEYYIKNGQFGVEGLGYEKLSQEMKAEGEYASSGYGERLGVSDNEYMMIKDLTETIMTNSGLNLNMMTDEQLYAQAKSVIGEIMTVCGYEK